MDRKTTERLHEFSEYAVDAYFEYDDCALWLNWEAEDGKNGICIGVGDTKPDAIRDALLVLSNAAEGLNRHLEKLNSSSQLSTPSTLNDLAPVDRFGGLNE